MIRQALLAAAFFAIATIGQLANAQIASTPLELWVDPDGITDLHGTTEEPLSFDSCRIESEANRLDHENWNNIGGIHVVPGASPSLIIRNGPDSVPTTVQVMTGGDVAFLDVFDSSLLELSGGIISFANLHNSAQALVNSGEIAHLTAYDSAQVTGRLRHPR